jgi:hypothetical protein
VRAGEPPAVPDPGAAAAGDRGPRAWWRGLPRRRRNVLWLLLAAAVLLVLVVSALLARFLTVENLERDDDLRLVQAEARGDVAGMLGQLSGCRETPSCVASVKADVSNARVHRSGAVKILQLESTTAYSLTGATGKTRLAWTVIGGLPVVQCVDVRRTGNFLSGIHVHLVGLSAPISGEGKCTKATQIEKEEEEATAVEQGR